jgi:hypothetical protein
MSSSILSKRFIAQLFPIFNVFEVERSTCVLTSPGRDNPVRGLERLGTRSTRTCWRLRCCISRISSDPAADLLGCTVKLIDDSVRNLGQGCRIGFRLLMQSFRPYQKA